MVLGGTRATDLFEFADDAVNESILNAANRNDHQAAMDRLFEEVVLNVSDWFQEFGYGFIETVFENELGTCRRSKEALDMPCVDSVNLPYFVCQ
jgi:hypothetical protein